MTMQRRYHGCAPLHNDVILKALGLRPGNHLPDEGTVEIVTLGGIRYTIRPKGYGLSQSSRAHRTVAECPHCHLWFCAGHLHQHMPSCPNA